MNKVCFSQNKLNDVINLLETSEGVSEEDVIKIDEAMQILQSTDDFDEFYDNYDSDLD